MLTSQVGFADAFAVIFQPILNEQSLTAKYPQAANTLRNIETYKEVMGDLRDAIQPELDLLDSRVTAPLKEYQDLVKKVRKTVTKREHKVSSSDCWMSGW
jgi:amphiphysin